MRKIQLVALALLLLQACAPDIITGTGPVTLTSSQQQHFDKYRKGTHGKDPLYFFLIKGGQSFSVYCPETAAICREATETKWYSKCEEKYGTGSCKLYGVFGQVAWKKDQPADPNWYNLYPESPQNVGGMAKRISNTSAPVYRFTNPSNFSEKTNEEIQRLLRSEEKTSITASSDLKRISQNPYLSKYLEYPGTKVMFGGFPLGCNYRYFYRGYDLSRSIDKAKEGCEKKIIEKNEAHNMECKCRLVAIDNSLLWDLEVYESNTNLETDYMLSRLPKENLIPDEEVCEKALNYYWPNQWTKDSGYLPYVKIAKQRGYSTDDCNHILGRPVNRPTKTRSNDKADRSSNSSFGKKFVTGAPSPVGPNKDQGSPSRQFETVQQRLEILKNLEKNGLITSNEARKKRQKILGDL